MEIHELLLGVQQNKIDISKAEEYLKELPYQDMGFCKLDHHRALRSGFGETIYCEGKTKEQLVKIYESFAIRGENVLGTRATKEQYEAVKAMIPNVEYEETGRILSLKFKKIMLIGEIAVCTGGTTDIPVAEEAALTAEFFGCKVNRIYDVGVAGIHRLLSKTEEIRRANCIVAIAGMEGALGGVIAGLVERPVIAVPTSVGYGANFHGLSALLTMLNSCAEGLSVVNIDNGFGAGYMAAQINRLGVEGGKL
ncbi:MAG: nickel pincer cofactor biosynthesis protein LarB [Lachnospiraceae bacterium]